MSDASVRERVSEWLGEGDLRVLAAVMLVLYLVFGVFSLAFGLDFNGTVSTLERVTFFAIVYALVTLALNLQWGYAGLFNIGIAGFMAISVYTMSILTMQVGLPYPVGALGGIVAAGLFGALVALPALRLRADYLAIVTLAFAEIVRSVLSSQRYSEITVGGYDLGFGGATGPDSPPDILRLFIYEEPANAASATNALGDAYFALFSPFAVDDSTAEGLLYLVVLVGFLALFYALLTRVGNSPFGRVLKAIREDETVARALGKDTRVFKIKAFALGSALMGLAAILWYLKRGGVRPDNFIPETTFFIFVALIIGGAGSNTGSVVGGAVFGGLLFQGPVFVERIVNQQLDVSASPATVFDAFTGVDPFLAYTIDNISSLRVVLLGAVLIYLIQRRPEGILGDRKEVASGIDLEQRSGGEN